MSKGLDLIIVILFMLFLVAFACLVFVLLNKAYVKSRQILREEEEADVVHDRLIHPDRYEKKDRKE